MSRRWLACVQRRSGLSWLAVATALASPAGPARAASGPSAQRTGPVAPGRTGPALEVSGSTTLLALPAVPGFTIPTWPGDLHGPLELVVAGNRLRGQRLRVGGYITWIYDCAAALGEPGQPRAQIQRRIDADPALCERPKFYLGDTRDAPPERSVSVVDVPRPPSRRARARLPAAELARWPAVPRLTVGAYVEVTGTFAFRSPHGEVSSDGLIVYEAIDTTRTPPGAATPVPAPRATLPVVPRRPPPRCPMVPATAGESIRHASAGHRAYMARQYDAAIAEYEAAVRAWRGNDAAWYGLAGARSWRGAYRAAAEAAGRSVALVPDQAMYWLLYGQLLHDATLAEARDREANAQHRRADRVAIDRSALDFTPALEALLAAARLEDQLWRAHYYIGQILRDRGDSKAAAEQLTSAIALHAWEPGPYVALAELYRRWRYRDEALAIAELATATLPGSADAWYELGAARDDRDERDDAIAAFTRALELEPGLTAVRFQRGRAYLRVKDFAHARRDLEGFVQAGGTSFELDQARRMLAILPR